MHHRLHPVPILFHASGMGVLSIRHKLFATILLVVLLTLGATGYLGYHHARASLEAVIWNQLTGIRKEKARQIEDYFHKTDQDVRLLGANPSTVVAMREFLEAFRKVGDAPLSPRARETVARFYRDDYLPRLGAWLGREPDLEAYLPADPAALALQGRFLADNPHPLGQKQLLDDSGTNDGYDLIHKKWHPFFRRFVEGSGLDDLILVDPKSGREIYTVKKEPDFGASLRDSPLRSDHLTEVALACSERSQGKGVTRFGDFKGDPGAAGLPSAYIGTPIYDGEQLIGVLVVEISTQNVDRIMTDDLNWQRYGLGTTGDAYLAGPDHLLRSSVRPFLQDPETYYRDLRQAGVAPEQIEGIRRAGTPVLQREIRTKAVLAALNGVEGTTIIPGYRGNPVLTSYQPVNILGATWALVTRMDQDEAFATIARLRDRLALLGAGILAAAAVLSAWIVLKLTRPMRALTEGAYRINHGDYSVRVPVESRDELGELSAAFNSMIGRIEEKTAAIERKNGENEALLLNILPGSIANRLRSGEQSIADQFAEVSVLFADIVGFTTMASATPADEIVEMLNGLFSRFDSAAQYLEIEKIKTIGDAYMAVCGLPVANKNHAQRMTQMAVRMIHIAREYGRDRGIVLRLRIGINSGPVIAGVIGQNKFIYDLWGDTVNLASRMESNGLADSIQVTREVYDAVHDQFPFTSRGLIEIKGKGRIETWILEC